MIYSQYHVKIIMHNILHHSVILMQQGSWISKLYILEVCCQENVDGLIFINQHNNMIYLQHCATIMTLYAIFSLAPLDQG